MNMCFLEVAMCEKCRSTHFQSEGGVKSFEDWVLLLGAVKNFWCYCTFVPPPSPPVPPLLLLMTHHEKTRLKALP